VSAKEEARFAGTGEAGLLDSTARSGYALGGGELPFPTAWSQKRHDLLIGSPASASAGALSYTIHPSSRAFAFSGTNKDETALSN
jgi:hypothetical protein